MDLCRLAAAVVLLGLVGSPARAEPAVQLRVRVAECGGAAPVRPRAWVEEHVEAVRALLAPHGIAVTAAPVESFRSARCELLTRADRDALAAEVKMDGAVTVLVL